MKEVSHTMKLSAATMLAMLLGSYLYSSSVDAAELRDISKVNGGIRVSSDATLHGSLTTVNGGIQTNPGTEIERRVSTVNGKIRLRDTRVGEDVQTSNGDIFLTDGSIIEGDIVVKDRRSWLNRIFGFEGRNSRIIIDSNSAVRGDIHLYREVDLDIADGAEVGDVIEHF